MKIRGQIMNASEEMRELVNKDGTKVTKKVYHLLVFLKDPDDKNSPVEVLNIRAYDPRFDLPKVGALNWESPPIKKYECFNGQVAEVLL